MAITIGSKLGAYEITALLGAGGMGEVYKAIDESLVPRRKVSPLLRNKYQDRN